MGHLSHYVCLYVPEFLAQARLRLRPGIAKEPVVILEGDPPLQIVCGATQKARAMGIAVGTTRAELDSFPGVIVLLRSELEERAARAAVLHMVETFTPRVEEVKVEACFVCVLDMAGSELILGDSVRVAAAIHNATRALGLVVRLASACNFHASICVAPFARSHPVVLPPGKEKEWLGRLPVSALRLTDTQASRFELWGVRTLRDIAELPEQDLVVRFGQDGTRLRQLAIGQYPHLMVPKEPAFALEDAAEFDSPEDRLEALLFIIGPMLDQLIVKAQSRALSLASVSLCLLLDGGGEHIRTLKPALPLADRSILLKLFHLDIQGHPPPAAVVGLRLSAEPGRRGTVQSGLFSPQLPEPTRLDVTLAQIEAIVGEGRVGSPRLLDTNHPEDFTMERFNVSSTSSIVSPSLTSAMRRIRPAAALRVWLDVEGRPESLAFEGKRYRVLDAYGPWQKSGEWWSQRGWSRDEWDIRAVAGESQLICVLSQDRFSKQWALAALYD